LRKIGRAARAGLRHKRRAREAEMTDSVTDRYRARMQRVLDHIDRHLDGDLGVETLAGVAAFSKFHFHRQFTAMFGVGVARYVQGRRLERAAAQLAFRDGTPVTDIAFDAGYAVPEAFGRAFKQVTGQTPTAFRADPDWAARQAMLAPLLPSESPMMFQTNQVRLVDMPTTPILFMRHQGDPALIGATIRRFIAWRHANRLGPQVCATFNIFHTDPDVTPAAEARTDLAIATSRAVVAGDDRIEAGSIPGGRCAVLRITGGDAALAAGFAFLYRDWLSASREAMRDLPPFCQRITLFPDVPAHVAATDLFLPLV
jgi:AraC family transcriptional regulator